MDIKDKESFVDFYNKLKSNPKFYLQHADSLIPQCWHLSYYNQKEKERDIYTLYWKSVVIAKIKVNRSNKESTSKYYDEGIDFFLKNSLFKANLRL
tara:strand:+ start:294 stop:581 length:288 start_codon:yes stop_codon:yes gene_type:complete